jgi:hypothetical protein
MSKPTIKIHNIETGEIIERDMNAEELKNYEATIARNAAQDKELADKAVAKAAIAERLGLSADELATLLA